MPYDSFLLPSMVSKQRSFIEARAQHRIVDCCGLPDSCPPPLEPSGYWTLRDIRGAHIAGRFDALRACIMRRRMSSTS